MSPFTYAVQLVRQRPALVIAWLAVLALPTILGLAPLSSALGPYLDLRPAADHLVTVPVDDGLFIELLERSPDLTTLAFSAIFVTLAIGVPLVWLLAGFVAATVFDAPPAPRIVAGRACGIAIVALPLRALPWIAALGIAWRSQSAQTFAHALPNVVTAIVVYVTLATVLGAIVDLARGVALDDPALGLWRALAGGWQAARRHTKTFFGLCALDLLSMTLAVLPIVLSRPLGVLRGGVLVASLLALVVRAGASVVGIAAAARVSASRSA